jgi:hypothetical protein
MAPGRQIRGFFLVDPMARRHLVKTSLPPRSLGATTGATIRGLKAFGARRLAAMHGSTFEGDCGHSLDALADYFDDAHRRASKG